MPYISTEQVKEIRNALKVKLPKDIKLSVKREHHSSLVVSVMSTPLEFCDPTNNREYTSINPFWYETHGYSKEWVDLFKTIMNTINDVHPKKTVSVDGDYGNIPNYYINLNVGQWDKPYKQAA